jgi:tetraacyldisaccharide 4'-kinase
VSGPPRSWLAPLLSPAAWAYGRVVAARNARFDAGRGVERLPRPVISIGNITAGGTGKTPMTIWVAGRLGAAGVRPAIALRGYGANVRDGDVSDEQAEYAEALLGAAVLADPDRAAAVRRFLESGGPADVILLDDGFQHRRVHRDLDLVLVDATAGTMDDRLLPAGRLREPLDNLRRAGAVIVTRAEGVDPRLAGRIERHHGRPPLAWSRHGWTGLRRVRPGPARAGEPEVLPVAWLQGRRIVTMLGVGHPRAILAQLEAAGARVAANVPAADHERYGPAKVAVARGLCDGAEALVVTRKDWVKLRDLIEPAAWPAPIIVPQLEIEVFHGAAELEHLLVHAARCSPAAPDR